MLKVENVSYFYGDGEEETTALKNVSIEFLPEHIFAVLGESGSGKTTLLNCLAQFQRPQQGLITYDGQDIYDIPELEFRRKVGFVFQGLHLFPHMTVLENLTLAPEKALRMDAKTAESEAREVLEHLSIGDLADSYPAQISGGQAQRAAIARGLVLKPEYMLLDEPTSALDAKTSDEFGKWLVTLKSDTHFVIVTHDTLFAERVATHGVYLSHGEVLDTGKVENIIDHVRAGSVQ